MAIKENSNIQLQLALDYHFGWRWLLPSCSGQHTEYFGLNYEEQKWWIEALAKQSLKAAPSPVEGFLIALDRCDINSVVDKVGGMYPSWLCAWGSGLAVSRLRKSLGEFESVREYALLPVGSPRVVVPLSSSEHVVAGLCLHRPGRWVAQFGLLAARSLAKFGYFGLVRRRVLLVATRSPDCPVGAVRAKLSTVSKVDHKNYVLYLGTPDDNRKTVVLPLGNSSPEVILKIAQSPKARVAVKNEANALKALAVTSLAHQVPKLIGIEETGCSVTLYQEYRNRLRMTSANMNRAAVDFLVELSRQECRSRPLAEMLAQTNLMTENEARAAGQMAYAKVRAHLDVLAAAGAMVWGHRSHGDFAPWNCSWTTKGFFVFDWEASRSWYIALGDAFYFVIASAVHVARLPNTRAVEAKALSFAMSVVKEANLPIKDIRIYWLIWLLQRMNYQPTTLYVRLLERQATSNWIMHPTRKSDY